MLFSRIFYTCLTIAVAGLAILGEKKNKIIFAWAIVLLLTFVAGFRAYSVGSDTSAYVQFFENGEGSAYSKSPGFKIVCNFLLKTINNPTYVFLVFGFLIYSLIIMRFWEMRKNIGFSVAVIAFFSICFFETMNGLRQYIAVALFFYGTRYLNKRKYFPFIVFVALASIFHITGLLGFLCLGVELLMWKKLNDKQKIFLVCLIVLGCLAAPAIIMILSKMYVTYAHYFDEIVLNLGFRIPAFIGIWVLSLLLYQPRFDRGLLTRPDGKQDGKYFLTTVRLYFILGCLLGVTGYLFPYMERVAWYYVPFECAYFSMIIKEEKKKNRWMLQFCVVFVIAYILFNYLFVLNGSQHHPYRFIWG